VSKSPLLFIGSPLYFTLDKGQHPWIHVYVRTLPSVEKSAHIHFIIKQKIVVRLKDVAMGVMAPA
jgi:hypothetical protein